MRRYEMNIPNYQKLLRNKQAAAYLSISTVTLWRLENSDPDFPKKIRLSSRVVGFLESDLEHYLLNKAS